MITSDYINLGGIIVALEAEDPTRVLPLGFHDPHSYRGYYEQLAFAPAWNITIGEMLAAAKSAVGATFEGWKGGEYVMSENTDCWIANRGDTSDNKIGPMLLRLLLSQGGQDLVELEPPKPALPPQPAVGGLVMVTVAERGASLVYRRSGAGDYGCEYECLDGGNVPTFASWGALCLKGTPVPLVPAPDLADMVILWRSDAAAYCDRVHESGFDKCGNSVCADRRALMIKYETGARP